MILQTALFILIGSIALTAYLLPKIIGVARYKELMDNPNGRSSHSHKVPRLGGVAFFITLMLSLYFIQREDQYDLINSLIPCLTILFVVGLKDDLVVLTAKSKFLTQLIVATFLVFDPELNITGLNGFLEVYAIHPVIGYLLVYVIVTGIINAINLIDGIDGLASGISLVALSSLAFIFYLSNKDFTFLLMMSMIGVVLAFLPFNLSEEKHKIFMGDTGSMLIGFILSFGVIRLLTIDIQSLKTIHLPLANLPFLMLFILFIPVMDTLRVMTVRMIRGKGPFSPDRTHLHHFFLDNLGWSHVKTSLAMTIGSLLITLIGYTFCYYFHYSILIGIFSLVFGSSLYFSIRIFSKQTTQLRKIVTQKAEKSAHAS
ncbi:MAG: undecaprenyl/decaprenyl-phosphate alpha-N-acetylglucosaminyl 1-phosphate transferase [Bacteroidetes bacterium]|nr:undecaprenyl/decaprenyl-phosphate alpha-N-acetylglucosaminyl 1-phosphate transferase [Bacteroidota bacterium]